MPQPGENQAIGGRPSRSRRAWPWIRNIAGGLVTLLLFGLAYESIARARDAKRYPPPGDLVSVGNHRLHLHCMGSGSPTVVLEAGSGAVSPFWLPIQLEISKVTRVCAYDRAGYGWSDPATTPRTGQQVARELHTLLQAAEVKGPYVFAAASLGGMYARSFNQQYPDEVAGMVLIDARHEAVTTRLKELGVKEQFPGGPVEQALARSGLFRLLLKSGLLLSELFQSLPPDVREATQAQLLRSTYFPAVQAEFQVLAETEDALRSAGDLGAKPLVVLTHGHPFPDMTEEANWQEHQVMLAALSSRGRLVVAERSGHEIQIQQPDLVANAIREVIEATR